MHKHCRGFKEKNRLFFYHHMRCLLLKRVTFSLKHVIRNVIFPLYLFTEEERYLTESLVKFCLRLTLNVLRLRVLFARFILTLLNFSIYPTRHEHEDVF